LKTKTPGGLFETQENCRQVENGFAPVAKAA